MYIQKSIKWKGAFYMHYDYDKNISAQSELECIPPHISVSRTEVKDKMMSQTPLHFS